MLEWLGENAWVAWMVLAALLAVTEMLTLDLTLLMLAAGAVAGGIVALVFPGLLWLQIVVAVVVAVAMLGLLRPTLLRRLRDTAGLSVQRGQDGRQPRRGADRDHSVRR